MSLVADDVKVLSEKFPAERLGVKVQSLNREKTKAMLVLYLQHTDVMDRIEKVDPAWKTEVLEERHAGDTVYVRMRMIIKGVARENVGEGNEPKGAYSDALKRCAMLFGCGRYLYDSETVWVDYSEQRDRYKTWTVEEYEQALKRRDRTAKAPTAENETLRVAAQSGQAFRPTAIAPVASKDLPRQKPQTIAPPKDDKPESGESGEEQQGELVGTRSREDLNRRLMGLYRPLLQSFPETVFVKLLASRYGVQETRLCTLEQLEDLVSHLEYCLSYKTPPIYGQDSALVRIERFGDYAWPFGELKGKRLNLMTDEELRAQWDWVTNLNNPKGASLLAKKALSEYLPHGVDPKNCELPDDIGPFNGG